MLEEMVPLLGLEGRIQFRPTEDRRKGILTKRTAYSSERLAGSRTVKYFGMALKWSVREEW